MCRLANLELYQQEHSFQDSVVVYRKHFIHVKKLVQHTYYPYLETREIVIKPVDCVFWRVYYVHFVF